MIRPIDEVDIVSIHIKIKAGLCTENELSGSGITHFIEHMIFKGTTRKGAGQIEKEIKKYGGYINATTDLDTTSFFVTVPSKHFKEAMALLSEAVMNPQFDEEELERERSVILNEIKLRNDDPSRKIFTLLFKKAFLSHSYRHPVIGYKELLKKLNRNNLVSYHERYYVPNNMALAIVGKVNLQEALEQVKKTFGRHQRQAVPPSINEIEPQQITERISENIAELNLGYLAVGYHSTGILNKDLFALDVLAMVLGTGDESRLNRTLVKEKELLYSVDSINYTPFYPGLFIITGIGAPANLGEAVKVIKSEIENLKKEGIAKFEYERAKANVMSSYLENLETVQSQAASMAEGQMLAGDPEFYKKYIEGIEKVKPDDITNVASKYLNDENRTIVYLRKQKTENREQRTEVGKMGEEASRYVLANGLRVVLKEDHRLPLVNIVFSCLGGLRSEEADFNGISNLTAKMLLKGTKVREEKDIKSSLENRGGRIEAFSGMNSFGLTIKAMSKDLDLSLALLGDVIKNSTFPEKEIKKLKGNITQDIKSEDDDIFSNGLLKLKKGIFKTHPYARRIAGEIKSMEGISRKNIIKFYKKILNTKNIVIVCIGDFNQEGAFGKIRELFQDAKPTDFTVKAAHQTILSATEEELSYMPKEEALFLLGFRGVNLKSEDRYVLDAISSIMSGRDGRLFDSIRNKLGLSYTQGINALYGIDPGYIFLYAATDKKDIGQAKEIILSEISRIKREPVSDEELIIAKNSLIGNQIISLQRNEAMAFTMALDELYTLGFNNYLSYEENIEKCSKDDIIRVANEYLDLGRSFSVTILPKEK